MPKYWKSPEDLANDPALDRFVEDEFPSRSREWLQPVNRREVLRLMAASFALAGLNACTRQPREEIVPYVRQPEEFNPDKPLFFATAMPMSGYGKGVLVENHLGRPTKIEGNPQHPMSLGATGIFAQASVLDLYDPDRSRTVINNGRISTWGKFLTAMAAARERHTQDQGRGLRIVSEPSSSPTLNWQMADLQKRFPAMQWLTYDPIDTRHRDTAFGQPSEIRYDIGAADVIVSFDCDFLTEGPASLRDALAFADRRRLAAPSDGMNRLYAVEPFPSATGGCADHRIPLRAADLHAFAYEVARSASVVAGPPAPLPQAAAAAAAAIAKDLRSHRGSSLVLAGDHTPVAVHAITHAINEALGNIGRTVSYSQPVRGGLASSLRPLVNDLNAGVVKTMLIVERNPVFDAPFDLAFSDALKKAGESVHLGLHQDETAEYCRWHIPAAHYLESWSDVRAVDGTASLIQPLIEPLYGGRTAHELLASLTDQPDRLPYDIVRDHWRTRGAADFEPYWRKALHDGIVTGEAPPAPAIVKAAVQPPAAQTAAGLELVLRPDPCIWDGRFANNGWLQELPKPLTKMTWDNAAHVSPRTAQRLGLANEDVIELRFAGRTLEAPAWIVPGQADESICLHLGYGRSRGGEIAEGTGVNAYALRSSDQPWGGAGLEVRKTGRRYPLAATQDHHSMEGRPIVRTAVLEEFHKDPQFAVHEEHTPLFSLYPEFQKTTYAWGMAIDQNACVGCNACVIACQAENNIPVVGKREVQNAREMHWIRIDRYFEGDLSTPAIFYQPMLCQHCEKAPCEVVCPVAATVHSDEGLNQMVYNRCVGTRYCSNNCPYKVRRFNFFLYADWYKESLYGLRNPDVTVRSRGVMEKCTYCIQRIQEAKIESEKEDRLIADGEIRSACEQVCPSRAIVFGNINDPNSRVSKVKASPRNYGVLSELNTVPRTTYLARVTNPYGESGGNT